MSNYGVWNIEDNFIVASPLMDGFDFSEYKPEEHGLLDVELMLDILQKVAIGLAAAHHRDILHHNICPANIHLDARGNLRLKNFFISRFLYKNCPINDWEHDISPFEYMSPEKIKTREEGKAGDVFSLGVLSYFLLTGCLPFDGKNREEIVFSRVLSTKVEKDISKIKYRQPAHPHDLRDKIPSSIGEIIIRMLSPLVSTRPSLGEFISVINFHKAEMEKDRIYDAQWNMIASDSGTKPIPRLDKLGLSGADTLSKSDLGHFISIKSLFDKKHRRKNE